jgi:hypothetical protein
MGRHYSKTAITSMLFVRGTAPCWEFGTSRTDPRVADSAVCVVRERARDGRQPSHSVAPVARARLRDGHGTRGPKSGGGVGASCQGARPPALSRTTLGRATNPGARDGVEVPRSRVEPRVEGTGRLLKPYTLRSNPTGPEAGPAIAPASPAVGYTLIMERGGHGATRAPLRTRRPNGSSARALRRPTPV